MARKTIYIEVHQAMILWQLCAGYDIVVIIIIVYTCSDDGHDTNQHVHVKFIYNKLSDT